MFSAEVLATRPPPSAIPSHPQSLEGSFIQNAGLVDLFRPALPSCQTRTGWPWGPKLVPADEGQTSVVYCQSQAGSVPRNQSRKRHPLVAVDGAGDQQRLCTASWRGAFSPDTLHEHREVHIWRDRRVVEEEKGHAWRRASQATLPAKPDYRIRLDPFTIHKQPNRDPLAFLPAHPPQAQETRKPCNALINPTSASCPHS